jgi:hypothetical protein
MISIIVAKLEENLKRAEVVSWKTPRLHPKQFIDFRVEASKELDQEDVHPFEQSHLDKGTDGFFRDVKIFNPPGSLRIEEYDFVYIKNGQIIYAQKDNSRRDKGYLEQLVSWRDANFIIDENYGCCEFPRNDRLYLFKKTRTAEFIVEPDSVRIEVKQNHKGEIHVYIDEYNEKRKKGGYGEFDGAIRVGFDKKNTDYKTILREMQANPNIFSDPRDMLEMLKDLEVDESSHVYYGFENGKRGEKYGMGRVIEGSINLKNAIEIAFPQILKK